MVPVRVLGLAVDSSLQPVVLLTPVDGAEGLRTLVPIWVGTQEAASISVAVSGDAPPRPLSHDLMQSLLEAVGAAVVRAEVTRLEAGTYYAELTVTTPTGPLVLDSRPSDAIALAARTGAPLFVAEAVLTEAGVLEEEDDGTEDEEEPGGEDAEERVAEFRRFLDDVDPEDFQG